MRHDPRFRRSRSCIRAVALGAVLHVCAPAQARSQADTTRVTVSGTVVDAVSKRPLDGVRVLIPELGVSARSDADGRFVLAELRRGTYELTLEREGYQRTTGPLQVLRPGSFVVSLTPAGGAPDAESSRISGWVSDQETGEPLEGVEIAIGGTAMRQVSDKDGRFAFPAVAPGSYTVSFTRLGYARRDEAITVRPSRVLSLEIRMGVEPIGLEPIAVSVEARRLALDLAGFYARREATSGIFIAQDQIEERHPVQTTDLFMALPGVRVIGSGLERSVYLRAGLQSTLSQLGCAPLVYLDGIPVGTAADGNLDRVVNPIAIAGIEIYVGVAKIPLQYLTPGSNCGVIVMWTR